MDVDTRLLRSFVAVAREGGLTRAAEVLFVSQPALTKQIRQLERALGVELFTRSRAGMALTEPGRVLAERTPALLETWDDAVRGAKAAAAAAARVLRVGFMASAANEATQQIIAAFSERRPEWRVEMRQGSWGEPTAGLADGEADVALLRLPFPGQDRWRVEQLLSEPRMVAMSAAHPMAARESLAFKESRFYARPGVVYRPVTGVPPSQVGVAWTPESNADPVVADFVACCLEHRTAQSS